MKRAVCLFEDSNWTNLKPLVYFTPVYELRCGILTLKEKTEKVFGKEKVLIHARNYISESIIGQMYDNILFDPNYTDEWIFVNGSVLADEQFARHFNDSAGEFILKKGEKVIGAFLRKENSSLLFAGGSEFPDFGKLKDVTVKQVNTRVIEYPWDLIKYNGEEIANDFKLLYQSVPSTGRNFEGVIFKNRSQIYLGNYCQIEPFVNLNAEKGPIVIGDHAKIYAHTSIEGPAYIGHNSMIKTHACIYHNTSIGPVCKVGGEIENSIIHSYTNKQHFGFLGHSYLGQWINLGAGTTNSDLKNNYSTIRIKYHDKEIDTGMTFLGVMMGDYTKTAIGTRINTGSSIGACCNVFSDQTLPKYLPPFTWVNNNDYLEYDLDKIIETTKIVYSRRGIIFTDSDRKLFRTVFDYTKSERNI